MKKCGGSFKKKLLKGNKGRKERKKKYFLHRKAGTEDDKRKENVIEK